MLANHIINNDWCREEEVLAWISIIQISIGYLDSPETLTIPPEAKSQ